MKIYDKEMYSKQEGLKNGVIILLVFLIGFVAGYFAHYFTINEDRDVNNTESVQMERKN